MTTNYFNNVVEDLRTFITLNNIELPNSIKEYDILEVSTFNKKYHADYFKKIELKRNLIISSNRNLSFYFCNTLAEVRSTFIDS